MAEADPVESAAPDPKYLDWLRYLSAFLLNVRSPRLAMAAQRDLPGTCPDSQLIRAKKKAIVWERPRVRTVMIFEKKSS